MPFGSHTLLLSLDGGLIGFGNNSQGQLGLGHAEQRAGEPLVVPWEGPRPVQVDWGAGTRWSLMKRVETLVVIPGRSEGAGRCFWPSKLRISLRAGLFFGSNRPGVLNEFITVVCPL